MSRTVDTPINRRPKLRGSNADETPAFGRPHRDSVGRGKRALRKDAGALSKGEKKKATPTRSKTIIGWREWAAFPDLGVERIKAKIDTGAKTSAIHAFRIKETAVKGVPHVEFFLHPVQRRRTPEIFCRAALAGKRVIRSSNGEEEERYVIETRLLFGGRAWKIVLTLTDRDAMGFRLLIGRDAIGRNFIIDPDASYLLGDPS